LRQLARDLFTWGTPLAGQPGTVRVEMTIAALAELTEIRADTRQRAAMQPA
jgi:hypothetical protein